jgi:hypothetical protein
MACLLSLSAQAYAQPQQLNLTKDEAREAAEFIRKQKQVVLHCPYPDCEDRSARVQEVKRVETRKQGAYWHILVNGVLAEPDRIWFPEGRSWFNLAIRLGLLEAGVAEELPFPPGRLSQEDCLALEKRAEKDERRIVPVLRISVIGKGRLHFHRAPHADCRDDKVFVIPGDSLNGYAEYENWTWVMYVNPASGKDFKGWVPDSRLKSVGTVAPR